MIHKRIELSTGLVDVYDGAVPMRQKSRVHNYLTTTCSYSIGWNDRHGERPHLHSRLDESYPVCTSLPMNLKGQKEFDERTEGLNFRMVIANLSTPSSIHHSHTHYENELVVLYYANLEWQEHWEGETMFFGDDGEVEYTSRYTPGRLLVFDGGIPHTIRAQSPDGPDFRFTVSYFMVPEKVDAPETQG